MKMVSASKLRRAQNAILGMRPYASKLQDIMKNLSHDMEDSASGRWAEDRGGSKVLLVTITSNRGLCGAFNANVAKTTARLVNERFEGQYRSGNLDIMCIGKKGADILKSRGYQLLEVNTDILDDLNFEQTVVIAERLMRDFSDRTYDKIILIYNQFKNAAVQILQQEQYLPITESESEAPESENQGQANYIFEPNKAEILESLVPSSIKIQLYKALLDSQAAEHGARMTAMHKATENADELLKGLRLTYNKARQAAITKEILEIVSGAEALKG
jgi:F-type H+-transporting ATPase subunit gamma